MVKTTAKIEGMMCGMCESHINDAIRRVFDPVKVTSSHTKGETVIISKDPITEEQLKATIDETGYRLLGVSSEPYEKRGLFGFLKK